MQNPLHLSFLNALALTVDDPHRKNAGFDAFIKIVFQQIRNILGPKRVQIQDIFDWNLNRFHDLNRVRFVLDLVPVLDLWFYNGISL